MALLKQKHMKSGKSFDEGILGSIVQMGQRLETIDIDGIRYFPCRICNRLFKDEKLAICHLQKCKPRVYLFSNNELGNKSNKNEDKDPYEIIPEEIELEGQIVNNNCTNQNKIGSGNVEWRKNFRKYNNNNETEISPKKQTNSPAIKISTNAYCITKPKKNTVQSDCSNIESEEMANQELSVRSTSGTEATISKNDGANAMEKQVTKKKKTTLNTEKQRRNYRQLTEQEIDERLRKISERLKKHKQPEIVNEEQEEEERREIEERLSVLNKGSEVCVVQNGVKFPLESAKNNGKNCKVGIIHNIFREISQDNMDRKGFDKQRASNEASNSPVKISNKDDLNPQSELDEVVVVTQRPDGQLHACRKCSQVFLSSLELLRHSRRDHTYPRIIMAPSEITKFLTLRDRSHCPICEKPLSSTYKSIYVKHLQTHSCVLEHICPVCKKKFKRRDHMRAHQKRHIVGDNLESTESNGNEEMETEDAEAHVELSQVS